MSKFSSKFSPVSKILPLAFVVIFAAIGTIYLLASHAAAPYYISFNAVPDTGGNPIKGVSVSVTGSQQPDGNGSTCSPTTATTTSSADGFPNSGGYYANFSCQTSSIQVTAISYPGYHVCGCSQVKVGTNVLGSPNGTIATITMQADPVASPPPPAPPPSGGSGGGTPTKSPTTSTGHGIIVSPTPSTSNVSDTPVATDLQPATDSTSDLSGFSGPNVPNDNESTVSSSDGVVNVDFPRGAFGKDAYCSVDNGGTSSKPVKSKKLIGPYSIDCTDSDGNPLTKLKKTLTVHISLPSGKGQYVAYTYDNTWSTTSSSRSGNSLSFKLAKATVFAAAPKQSSSLMGIVLVVVAVIVVLGIIVFIIRFIQSRNPNSPNYGY